MGAEACRGPATNKVVNFGNVGLGKGNSVVMTATI